MYFRAGLVSFEVSEPPWQLAARNAIFFFLLLLLFVFLFYIAITKFAFVFCEWPFHFVFDITYPLPVHLFNVENNPTLLSVRGQKSKDISLSLDANSKCSR